MKKPPSKLAGRIHGPQTTAIHGGEPPRHGVGAPVGTPICRTSTFTFSSTAEMKRWAEGKSNAYIYTRYGNPTLSVAEGKIAALEGAEAAVVTASGMAAISTALLSVLKCGDELISTAQVYGGTYRLMRDVLPDMGIRVHHVGTDLAGLEELASSRTKCLYIETPTNPTLRLVDLDRAIAFAKKHKLTAIIDNTFATPVLQNPLTMGFDMVVHSATKALAGHSDVIAGAVAGSKEWMERIRHMVIYLGGSMDPDAAYLLIRGIRTLGVRVARQCENAMAVAEFLEKHPKVARVHYPGLRSHPDHKLAKQQIYLGGSMDPDAAYLLIRGIRTLGVRVARQCENAMAVAEFLEKHPKVARVHYPGLRSHPDHKLAKQQMRGFGSMLAFDMKGGLPAARRLCDKVRVFLLAASLGGVESLVILPIYSSHYNMSLEELKRAGVEPGTVRVSVGLEDADDLIADLQQALS